MNVRSRLNRCLCWICLLLAALIQPWHEDQPISTEFTTITLPIIMYHSLVNDVARTGDYVLLPSVFEKDVQCLLSRGYTTVLPSQVQDALMYGTPLPEKPVMLTFDDGHLNALTSALPILQKYGCQAVVSVVGAYTAQAEREADPNPRYAYCRWEDLQALADSGCIELACHSYGLHDYKHRHGATRSNGESMEVYRQVLEADNSHFQQEMQEHLQLQPHCYTYPFGFITKESEALLKEQGYTVTLSCAEHINHLHTVEDLYGLGRFNRPTGPSSESYLDSIGVR